MRNSMLKVSFLLAFTLLSACQNQDSVLATPSKAPVSKVNYGLASDSTQGLTLNIDTRMDILLVVDDSESMRQHQETMSKNFNAFVEAFAQNKSIDFHIAYTYVHDRKRYGPEVPSVCGADTTTPGRMNWETPGTLKQLVGPANLLPTYGRRYLTSSDDFRTLLKANLDPNTNPLNIKNYVGLDSKKPSLCPEGPENEESFTPVLGALENSDVMNGPNKGFRRPGAFFVAIIFSDAKDESVNYGTTPQEFIRLLKHDTGEDQTGKKRSRVFAVAIKPGDIVESPKDPGCHADPAFATLNPPNGDGHEHYTWQKHHQVQDNENPLVVAADLTADATDSKDEQALSICSNDYGITLAKFGFKIQQDALSDLTLNLPHRRQVFAPTDPDYAKKHMQVFIGTIALQEGVQWDYNPQGGSSVVVYANKIDWAQMPNEKIRVTYTPVDDTAPTTKSAR